MTSPDARQLAEEALADYTTVNARRELTDLRHAREVALARALLSALDAAEKQSQEATAGARSLVVRSDREQRLRAEHASHRQRGTCVSDRPEECLLCEDMEDGDIPFLLRLLDEVRARAESAEEALREIVHREACSEYKSIYSCPGEFAAIAKEALDSGHGSAVSPKGSDRPALDALEQAGGGEAKSGGTAELSPVVEPWQLAEIRALFEDESEPRHGDVCGTTECWAPAYQQLKAGGRVLLGALDALSQDPAQQEPPASAVSAPPPSVEALEAERDSSRRTQALLIADSVEDTNRLLLRAEAAEVGRDQANKERDEAREFAAEMIAMLDASGMKALARTYRSALAGVPGGPKSEEQDLGGTAPQFPIEKGDK